MMFKRAHKADYIAFNIELVKAVEKHPCLYDYNVKEYCNREFVQDTWEKLARNFNCTAKECKDTWKNLRIVFSRNIKKQNSGISAKKKPYYLLDSMSYLIPFMKLDNTSAKQFKTISEAIYYETTSDDQTSNKDEEEDYINSFHEQQSLNISKNLELRIKEECNDSSDERFLHEIPKDSSRKIQKIQNELLNDINSPELLIELPKTNQRTQLSDTNVNNSCDCSNLNTVSQMSKGHSKHQFLLSLFSDVDDMNDAQFRLFRMEVCKLVNNIFTLQSPTPQSSGRTS